MLNGVDLLALRYYQTKSRILLIIDKGNTRLGIYTYRITYKASPARDTLYNRS